MFNPNPDNPLCKYCQSESVRKNGLVKPSKRHPDRAIAQRYRCNNCKKSFTLDELPRSIGGNAAKCRRWREGKAKKTASS